MNRKLINFTIFVAAFGYFVDIFDLSLFGILRIQSLKDLGYDDPARIQSFLNSLGILGDFLRGIGFNDFMSIGALLLNIQMIGMLVGGLVWGILGDRVGRKFILFSSIFMFSVGNFLNAFVQDAFWYAVLRFFVGMGLAGELGAAVTLISEIVDKEKRGFANALMASFGLLGAVVASLISHIFDWRTMYIIGAVLGFILLFFISNTVESDIFSKQQKDVSKGNVILLFNRPERLMRYVLVFLLGVPIWFVFSILIIFSPEVAQSIGLKDKIVAANSIMLAYLGVSAGDMFAGILTQKFRSRKKAIIFFYFLSVITVFLYFFVNFNFYTFYFYNFLLGFASGYWILFLLVGAENFGTNIRSTVVNTLPNFVRGSVFVISSVFIYLKSVIGFVSSAILMTCLFFGLSMLALIFIKETFGRDLDFTEE
ncbi:MAG: MFS transporter [bacterium]|nr:MFS transporter [bacterium]